MTVIPSAARNRCSLYREVKDPSLTLGMTRSLITPNDMALFADRVCLAHPVDERAIDVSQLLEPEGVQVVAQ